MTNHLRNNLVGYIALMVAVIGGGGTYAVAATTHTTSSKKKQPSATVSACVSDKTGEMFLHHTGRCEKGRHKVTWAVKGTRGAKGRAGAKGAAGPAGPTGGSAAAFGTIGPTTLVSSSGLTAEHENTGNWLISITNPACQNTTNVLVVSPQGGTAPGAPLPPENATPVADGGGSGTQFSVTTGYTANGSFTLHDYSFNVVVECGAARAPGQ